MIGRKHRFHGHGSLRFVYAQGKTVRTNVVAIRIVKNSRRSDYRVAVVVSKKISKSAVVRNRIRRRLYEQVRLHEESVPEATDLVLTVYSDQIATMEATELEKTVVKLLAQAAEVAA